MCVDGEGGRKVRNLTFLVTVLFLYSFFVGVASGLPAVLDDFEGLRLDPAVWEVRDVGGLSSMVSSGKLIVFGEYDGSVSEPGSGGWNKYWLFTKDRFEGRVDVSVEMTIDAAEGTEFGMGIGLQAPGVTGLPHENVVLLSSYFFLGNENTIGIAQTFIGISGTNMVIDPTDIVLGQSRVYRLVAHEDGLVEFYLDGVLKGSTVFLSEEFRLFLTVGIKYAGTHVTVSFDDVMVEESPLDVLLPPPPTLILTANPTGGWSPLEVTFASTVNDGVAPFTYAWTFGDGASGSGASVSHVYTSPGTFTAQVVVTDSQGRSTTETVTVTVTGTGLNIAGMGDFLTLVLLIVVTVFAAIAVIAIVLLRGRRRGPWVAPPPLGPDPVMGPQNHQVGEDEGSPGADQGKAPKV